MADENQTGWDPLRTMSLGSAGPVAVVPSSTVVPAGGLLTAGLTGFDPAARLVVVIDQRWDDPVAEAPPAKYRDLIRIDVPVATAAGPHLLTFSDGSVEFDLLVDVTANEATVTISPDPAPAGGPVRFEVTGFPPGVTAHVKLDGAGEAHAFTIDQRGSGRGSIDLPADLEPGPHHLRLLAAEPPTSARQPFTVTV